MKRWKKYFNFAAVFFISSVLMPVQTAFADVSVIPNKNLIDLSWPYNEKTLGHYEFRNFSMELVRDGERKASDGETIWYVSLPLSTPYL